MGRDLVDGYYAAMRVGADAEAEMMDLFTDDAVYIEPFTGATDPATGREAIRARLRTGWENPLPEMSLEVLTMTVTGDRATCAWECQSAAFPRPARGEDRYEFRDGLISRLEVVITTDPFG